MKKINYNGAKEVSYQYNKVGELVQMNDWTETNTFDRDLLGRLQKMTDHKGNTVSYAYDAVDNQTSSRSSSAPLRRLPSMPRLPRRSAKPS